ncbi:MAG: restriction endonuclease, partial [Paludibacteraceae bacterium]
ETPFAIAWSKDNVHFLKTNSGKKGEGMPVVRNPQFYFKEGFCWTDINSTFLKARLKDKGIFDVVSMSLYTQTTLPDWYFVCLINTNLMSLYVDNFINNTSHFQINDARQTPIIIPTNEQLQVFKQIFTSAQSIQKAIFRNKKSVDVACAELHSIQLQLEQIVNRLYAI